jgi:phosphate starvation-inducible PhoH-like protein
VRDILGDVEDIHFARLTSADVVRHRLVGDIVDAYERHDRAMQHVPGERPQHAKPRR